MLRYLIPVILSAGWEFDLLIPAGCRDLQELIRNILLPSAKGRGI